MQDPTSILVLIKPDMIYMRCMFPLQALLSESPADVGGWKQQLHAAFAFACVWALGGGLRPSKRAALDGFLRSRLAGLCVQLPAEGLLYDFDVRVGEQGLLTFVPWSADLAPASVQQGEVWVPTADAACVQRLVKVGC